uniref:Putative ovule protein n=1 Tax=Solanum chacoense TaxID=4108 RepID=A0A0V0GXU4_SOLCH
MTLIINWIDSKARVGLVRVWGVYSMFWEFPFWILVVMLCWLHDFHSLRFNYACYFEFDFLIGSCCGWMEPKRSKRECKKVVSCPQSDLYL